MSQAAPLPEPVDLDYVSDRVAECVAILSEAQARKASRTRKAGAAGPKPNHASPAQLLDAYRKQLAGGGRFAGAAAVRIDMLLRQIEKEAKQE